LLKRIYDLLLGLGLSQEQRELLTRCAELGLSQSKSFLPEEIPKRLTAPGLLTEYERGFLEGWTDIVLTAKPSYGWCSFDESVANCGGELLDCFS